MGINFNDDTGEYLSGGSCELSFFKKLFRGDPIKERYKAFVKRARAASPIMVWWDSGRKWMIRNIAIIP